MKILILAKNGDSTAIVYNKLKEKFDDISIIIEHPVDRKSFLKRRIKRLGVWKVAGQIAFTLFSKTVLEWQAKDRIQEIKKQYRINDARDYLKESNTYYVDSVNSEECRALMRKISPDIVVVNGTRIIEEETITCLSVPMINMHMGITPRYRGVHGAYWALAQKDPAHCGVTIHIVDKGIDTGNIISQGIIQVTDKDNFISYPYLQAAIGVDLEVEVIKKYFENSRMEYFSNDLNSKLWTHPTLREYFYFRRRGVK